MCRLQIGRHTIRIWRTEESLEKSICADNRDLEQWALATTRRFVLAETHQERDELEPCAMQLFSELEKFPRIAAVEILDPDLNGSLRYFDWP